MFATEKPKLRAAQRKDPATMALVEKNWKKVDMDIDWISMDIVWLMMVNHNLGGCTVNIWLILMVMMMVNGG